MGRTRKPCPGCGERRWDREVDKVCPGCARKIEAYNQMLADREERAAAPVMDFSCAPPDCCHWFPGYYEFYPRSSRQGDESRRELQRVVAELVWAVGESRISSNAYSDVPPVFKGRWESRRDIIAMRPEVQQVLQKLDEVIRKVIRQTFLGARRDALDVLNGLATGEVSVGEFGEIEEKWERQEEEE